MISSEQAARSAPNNAYLEPRRHQLTLRVSRLMTRK